jgi:thiosulfate/3-mercaptopyruvate sulfurtransferase
MQKYFKSALLDVKQLKEILNTHDIKNLRILDCTLPFEKGSFLYKRQRIPNSLFLDVAGLRDISSNLTMGFPKPENLRPFLEHLNISKNNFIVCYDQYGIYSSPRAWYIFKAYGFPYVCVLNGGFPKWLGSGYEIENEQLTNDNFDKNLDKLYDEENEKEIEKDDLKVNSSILAGFDEVLETSNKPSENRILVDTRHPLKFQLDNIPNSVNVPFMSLTYPDHTMKTKEELENVFEEHGIDNVNDSEIISSCTIGLTACIGFLALNGIMGSNKVKLYDGSYEEYSYMTNK